MARECCVAMLPGLRRGFSPLQFFKGDFTLQIKSQVVIKTLLGDQSNTQWETQSMPWTDGKKPLLCKNQSR